MVLDDNGKFVSFDGANGSKLDDGLSTIVEQILGNNAAGAVDEGEKWIKLFCCGCTEIEDRKLNRLLVVP